MENHAENLSKQAAETSPAGSGLNTPAGGNPAAPYGNPGFFAASSGYGAIHPPKPFVSDSQDKKLIGIAMALGVCVCEWILRPAAPGFSVAALTAAAYGGIFLYGRGCPNFRPRAGAVLDVPIVLTALCCAIFANSLLGTLNVLLLYLLLALRISRMFGRTAPVWREIGRSGFAAPFMHTEAIFKTMRTSRLGSHRTMGRIALGLLIAVPVGAVILMLLSSADEAFEAAMHTLRARLGEVVSRGLLDLIGGGLLAIFLFSLAYTLRYRDVPENKPAVRRLDSVIVATVIFVCAAIYIGFFIIQFRYLFSAVWGHLPTEYIYSEYARRGFFELTLAAMLNLLLTAAAIHSKSAEQPVMKCAVVLLAAETLVLIGSALSKMGMYIRVYGMSPLRLYTSWFMIGLGLVFVGLIIAQFVRFRVWNWLAGGLLVLYLTLNLIAPNHLIAQWNVRHYLNGSLSGVDFELLRDLGADAVPALVRLTEEGDAEIAREARQKLRAIQKDVRTSERSWCSYTVSGRAALNVPDTE